MIRVALIGPECTSKSTLAEELADYYQTKWVKEYAREFLDKNGSDYTLKDVLEIAKGQTARELEMRNEANRFLFSDTELIITKVWCEDVFKECPEWIENNISVQKFDLYLLTFPDIPWIEDPLRENPHRREFLFNWYEKELQMIHANYKIIKGLGKDRLNNAVSAVEEFLKENSASIK
ncbi:MAG: ATP-binding protein [Bacteroidota bacterium]|nr:ATP-binding protein [Bacteroidota bacterium]